MLSGLLRWFPGWVRVEGEGGYPERLLNELTRANIPVWRVQCREEWIRFSCLARDYRLLRPYARRACVRLRVRQKHGLPFWVFRYRHRRGLLLGAVLFVAILYLLAPRIWVVQVVGNTNTPTEDILAVTEEMGVQIGATMDSLDIKHLQINGLDELPTLAWITVNPSGCVARVEVTERSPTPEVLDLSQPSDIVALRDGRILWMEVRSGQRLVMDGEAVTAGTKLISGRVESELGEKLYRSYGQVWAETRRQITVTVPLVYLRQEPTGQSIFRPTWRFLFWDIPLYSSGPLPENVLHRQITHFLTAKEMTLPLGVTHDYYQLTRTVKVARTRQQAETLAQQQLAQEERALFLPGKYTQLSREGTVQGEHFVLTATYRCEEDIASEVPLSAALPEMPE